MSFKKRTLKPIYVQLLAFGILLVTILPAAAGMNENNPAQEIQQSWERAKTIGRFRFSTQTFQTNHPTANPANIGRGATTERFDLQGDLDSAAHDLQLQIWPKGRERGQGMELKVVDGVTLGRSGSAGEWVEVPEAADLFIQNGDPMGYLSAAENVREIQDSSNDSLFPGQLLPDSLDAAITRYRFDLNGLKYAQFMNRSMEDHLRRNGELPAGISLGMVQEYVDMEGEGELWLDAKGLPYRQIVHLQFPAGKNDLHWVEAKITTDYSNWDPRAVDIFGLDWSHPAAAVSSVLLLNGLNPQDALAAAYKLGLGLLLLGASALLFNRRFARQMRLAFSILIIASMVAGPLLQVQQAAAFTSRQEERSATRKAQETGTESQETAAAVFQPHANPLTIKQRTPVLDQPPTAESTTAAPTRIDPIRLAKASACTVGESSDCDHDGLEDKVEIFELGTFSDDVDTDNDGISDNIEVVGFSVGGEMWYMNPRNPDSNGDGLPDGLECSGRHNMNLDGTVDSSVTAVTCADTDKDGVPDVWDFDNDKDGVPDTVDNDPLTSHAVVDQQFGLTLAGYNKEEPLFVDITIRPTDDQHLWWTNNYLDWPDLDQHGQIMRVTTDTLGTDGDIMLSPLLEITIPFNSTNPSRSLPVKSGVDVSAIKATDPIGDWLDTDTLDLYSIVVHQDTDSGSLVVYAPLALTKDVVGDTPVAWSTRLYYKMATASTGWGHDHEMKVLWTVNGINDQCLVPEGESWASYCDVGSQRENTTNLSHWTSSKTILQTYYDDFTVTSLKVLEEQSVDAAVIAQKQGASGASAYYEDYLWHMTETLEETFLGAQLIGGNRMSVADIGSQYSSWGIPSSALYFEHFQDLADSTDLHSKLSGDNVITLLNTIYSGSSKPTYANLLFVGDKTFRTIGLDEESSLVQLNDTDSFITMDLTGIGTATTGFLRLSPYLHNGATWVNGDLDSYLSYLENSLTSVFTTSEILQLVDSSESYDFSQAQDGAISLAKNYYISLFTGIVTFLQDGSTVLSNGTLTNSLHGMPSEPVVTIVGELLDDIQGFYTQISLSNLTLTATLYTQLESVATSAWVALANSRSQVLEALGQVVQGDIATSNSKALQQLQYAPLISGDLSSLLNAGALDYTFRTTIGEALYYGSATTTLTVIYYSLRGVYKIYSAYKYFTGSIGKVSSLLTGIIEDYSTQLWMGYALVVGAAVASFVFAWATGQITPGSPEFAQKLAFEISTIIVATVVLVVLTVATGGIILGILALIAVIDAVAAIICAAVGVKPGSEVDQWVCGGLTGALVKALTYVINDYTPLIDLTHSGRLDNSMNTPTITQQTGTPGFVVGNGINLTTNITSTLYFGHPNWMGYAYADTQLTDAILKESTLKYELQTTPADINLNLNGTTWDSIGGSGTFNGIPFGARYRQNFEAPITYTPQSTEAGVNVGLGIYLAEGFAMHAQDCWLILADPVCWLETYKDTNQTDLSGDIIFDIFPETIDGFHDLTLVDNNSYKQSWDGSFPTLIDGDGDGLASKTAGGSDPDDGSPDTDGDGLSDAFEQNNQFDNTTADGDKDGLTDYWEAFFHTDPYNPDSDGDGLLDSEEAFHPNWIYPYENSALSDKNPPPNAPSQSNYAGGWEIVYDYNGSTALKTWVSADPNDPDSDDDSIIDLKEEIYGYNPLAASTLRVLGLHSEIQASEGSKNYPVPYATLTSQIGYTAVISNELSDRWALGLLQTEYPVDQVQATKELGILQPLETTSLSGSVSAGSGGLSASGTTSMTVRAGAIIESSDDHVLWLRMNEAAGATTFTDSSIYNHEAKCTECPTANGSYLSFSPTSSDAQEVLVVPADEIAAENFTLGMWVKVDTVGTITLYNFETIAAGRGSTNFSLSLSNSGINLVVQENIYATNQTINPGVWNHLLVTYDQSSRQTTLYVNGAQKWQQNTATILYGDLLFDILVGSGNSGTKFEMDEVELFDRVLDSAEVEQLFGAPVLDIDFSNLQDVSPSANSLSCTSGSTCPTTSSGGGTFDQNKFIDASGSALNFSGDEFTFSAWIKPETRSKPFDTDAVSAFNGLSGAAPRTADTNYDWQAVFGEANTTDPKKAAPSLFVNPKGQMRMFMGNGTTTCHVDTAEGLIEYGSWQHVTVSYDGSVFTFYINGREAAVSSNACAAVTPSNLSGLQIGRGADLAALYFRQVHFDKGEDGGGVYELRINYDGDSSSNNIWSKGNVTDSSNHTETINLAYYVKSGSHNFRFWEDDSSPNNNDYHECYKFCDDNLVYKTVSETAVSQTGSGFDYTETDVDYSEGTLYWSVSNDFFQGSINEFKAYTRAFSDEDALLLYEASYDGLYFKFDEPPGSSSFVDAYDDNVVASCDYAAGTCPDSGVAGISDQTADFQGGVDYLQLPQVDLLKTLNSGFTIAAWINPDTVSGIKRILAASRDNSINGFGFGLNGNKLLFTTFGVKDYNSSAEVEAGAWQHVAVVFDSSYDASFYVNGQFVDKIAGTKAANSNTDDPYRIGSTTNQSGSGAINEPFTGKIDELFVEERELDQSGILRLMQTAPVLNLHFDEDLTTEAFVNEVGLSSFAYCESVTACPGAGDKGQIRESVVFDGVDDILSASIYPYSGPFFTGLEEFTVGLWVNPTQIKDDYQPLVAMEGPTGGDRNFGLFIHPGSMDINMSMHNTACTAYIAKTAFNNPLLLHQWNHVMFTFDGSVQRLYINGTERTSNSYSSTPCQSSYPVKIGNELDHFTPFEGGIDEVTVRGQALTSYEVAEIFAYQSSWFDVKETHTVVIDDDNPTISLDRSNYYIEPGETVVKIAAQDPTSDVVSVRYAISGYTGAINATNTNGVWTFVYDFQYEGTYAIVLEATDSVGHVTSTIEKLYVDTQPPTGISGSSIPHAPTDGILFWSNILLEDKASTVGVNSGVDTDSLIVTVRDRSGNIVVPPVQGIHYQGDVFGAQIPFTFDPYGSYTFDASFKDNVGNVGGFSQSVILDSHGPHAEVLLHATTTLTPGMTLNGVAGDIEHIWQSRAMHLHFEQPSDTDTFIDPSRNEFLATCDLRDNPDDSPLPPAMQAQCPTAGVSGKYVDGISLDGVDDRLVVVDSVGVSATDAITTAIESRLSIYNSSFSIMAWVNADDWSGNRAVLGTDPTEDSEALFIGFANGKPQIRYGNNNISATETLPTGTWKHVIWRYDMDNNELSIFVDGVLEATLLNVDPYSGLSNTIYVGRAAGTDYFSGLLDEIAVYPLALTDDTIYDIANPIDSGMAKVEIRFREYDSSGDIVDDGTWYETIFNSGTTSDIFRTWEYTVPAGLNGDYKIDLRATDSYGDQSTAENNLDANSKLPGNERYVPGVWSGTMGGFREGLSFYLPLVAKNRQKAAS